MTTIDKIKSGIISLDDLNASEVKARDDDYKNATTPDQKIKHLFRFYDSQTRIGPLIDFLFDLRGIDFWKVFSEVFPSCDDFYNREHVLLMLVKRNQPFEILTDDDMQFYDSLPDIVKVYRGSDQSKTFGMSWTTERKEAVKFARGHRGIINNNPVIASGIIQKRDVLFAINSRFENELIIDPSQISEFTTSHCKF